MTPRIHDAALIEAAKLCTYYPRASVDSQAENYVAWLKAREVVWPLRENDELNTVEVGNRILREHIAGLEAEVKRMSEWKDAVEGEAANTHTFTDADTPREMLRRIIKWWMAVALDPAVSEDAQKLRDTYKTEWRSMETAPKSDGEYMIRYRSTRNGHEWTDVILWHDGKWSDAQDYVWVPIGWRSIPEFVAPQPPNTK